MKKIVSFEKEILFPTMIGEITSISLDNNLKFISPNEIEGNFTVRGTYKMTEASNLEEEFSYDVPVDISLMEELEIENSKIKIDDFFYSILNEEYLKCNIDVLIEGVEQVILEEEQEEIEQLQEEIKSPEKLENIIKEETTPEENNIEKENKVKEEILNDNRECDSNIPKETIQLDETIEKEEPATNSNISSIFSTLGNAEETYKAYSVYIVQGNESIEEILTKYKVTKEDLEMYQSLDNITKGTRLIIPSSNE